MVDSSGKEMPMTADHFDHMMDSIHRQDLGEANFSLTSYYLTA